jgi:S-adenosylmethionine/arginine decarboxylase-like enzyme
MEKIYSFLDEVPVLINMDPISRPTVITDKVVNPEIISGLTVIAQSHIALHYYKSEKRFWLDIFSCSFIECEDIISTVERLLGVELSWRLIGRGSKHTDKLTERDEYISRFNHWQENIR